MLPPQTSVKTRYSKISFLAEYYVTFCLFFKHVALVASKYVSPKCVDIIILQSPY